MHILLIEDDVTMSGFLKEALLQDGHDVSICDDGRSGLMQASISQFDVLIIDRMLPYLDGVQVVQALRSMQINTPVIMLTALGRVDERVRGLRAGADDYVVKPFEMAELQARIEAVKRRRKLKDDYSQIRVGDLVLDRLTHSARRGGYDISLKPREFRLLGYLMLHVDQVVTRTMLLEDVWDYHFAPQTSLVESHICRIRMKVDRGFSKELIQTVRGAGYRISAGSDT